MSHDILIVDDEADIRTLVSGILNDEGFTTRQAANADQVMQELKQRLPGLVVLDIWLTGSHLDGMQILQLLRRDYPLLPVIMISGHGNIETAVEAIKIGAYDFIEKPFKSDRLILQVQRALESARLKRENDELRLKSTATSELLGKSPAISQLKQAIEKAAPSSSRILISGPPGAGKEVVARFIHKKSKRANGPFVVLNCAQMVSDHWEVDLFGTEPKPTQATRKVGAFEQAHMGTLILDEIADLPLDMQGRLVRVLQEQNFERVGGSGKVTVDVRVIATTTQNLPELIAEGKFRQDLYYRLNVVPIVIPSLSERKEDIPLFVEYFLKRLSDSSGLTPSPLGEDTMAALQAYEWPGNVRQLRNVIEWLLIMAGNDGKGPIHAEMLPPEITQAAPAVLQWERSGEIMALPLRDAREIFEREYLLAQVTRFGGNISRTAGFIGMERSALHRKLKMLGVHGNNDNAASLASEQMN